MKDSGRLSFFRNLSNGELWRRIAFTVAVACTVGVAVVTFAQSVRWIGKTFPGFLINQRMVLGGAGQYHWTGTKAGLNYPDKVLEADGRPLKTPKDLEEAVRRKTVGDRITYTVERQAKAMDVAIPTMKFDFADFMVLYGVYFLVGIFYLVNVVAVFLMKPESKAAKAFAWTFLSLGTCVLMSFDVIAVHAGFIRVYMLLLWMIPSSAFYLSLVFPEEREIVGKYPWLRHVVWVLPAAMALPMELSYPGSLYVTLYSVTDYLMMGATLSMLGSAVYSYFRTTSSIVRQRAKVILLGMALAFPIPAIFQVMVSLGETVGQFQVLLNFLVIPPLIIFPMSVAYAIARHNLFDVDVFIKRAVGYAIMTVLVAAAYVSVQIVLESFVLAPLFGASGRKATPVVFAVLVVFFFNPFNRFIQDAVDRMFYRKKFDYKETVLSVGEALSTVLDMKEIVRKVVHTVRDTMFIDTSGLVLAGAQGEALRGHFVGEAEKEQGAGVGRGNGGSGSAPDPEREESISADDPLVALVARERKLITKYDVAEDPRFAGERDACSRRFEELGASLAVPLVHKGELRGILTVGHKKSGHFFTREDIELLQTLASHGAVAIENANLADRMKKEEAVRANLSRYLSPQIVDRIVKEDVKVNLGGNRKVVTILFSDIRNFTTITETRPPDQLILILNEYFTEMAKVIFEYQGSLDKYIGDAIVAVFGSLVPLENPARNAAQAALEMMRRLPDLNRRWETYYDFYMNIGIGINTGEVFLGNIGSPERMEFTVIGDAVNVASRFSGLAKAGQVLVTKETRACLGPEAVVRELPPADVKGKTAKMEVFELKGI